MAKSATKNQPKKGAEKPEKPQKPQKPIKRRDQVLKGPHGGMQLMLVEDVANLGRVGEIVEVRPGYGRNYLLPRGLATHVSQHNLRLLERHKKRVEELRKAKLADLKQLAEQLKDLTLTIESSANEENHLYGSVGPAEISTALKAQNFAVDQDAVKLEGAIKELGLYAVKIELAQDIGAELKVLVIPQQAGKAKK
jgi:large subunit ribosomal protein L9